jgi:L,D-peptidoglycan transpeptidase YkuD (ErfK/YbiS/YcfS/YnhG family)
LVQRTLVPVLALTLLVAATTAACPQNLANGLETPATARQLVTVEARVARTTYATLRTWHRESGCWVAAAGPYTARLGRNGLSSNRHEGDGTTPTGTYRIGRTMYGNEANPGVRFPYRRLRCGDWWNEDPSSPTYNTFQHVRCGTTPSFVGARDGLWQQPLPYPFLAVIEYNTRPTVPGRGSGIFLHAQTGGPTIGCISLRKDQLRAVLRWLRPGAAPVIAIGTTAQLR